MRHKLEAKLHSKAEKFLKLGGNPILDFCNTYVSHANQIEDRLETQKSAELFFKTFFSAKIALTQKQFTRLIELRLCLREYFLFLTGKDKSKNRYVRLAGFLDKVKLVIDWNQDSKTFSNLSIADKDQKFLQPIISNFFELSKDLDESRIKVCSNANCSHFFYDSTKNKTRSWCSMKSCGNLMKARRFQARKSV